MNGAPYHVGDPVLVNGCEARVVALAQDAPAPFGLSWCLSVRTVAHPHTTIVVRCDDDGRNHTAGMRVEPSSLVAA